MDYVRIVQIAIQLALIGTMIYFVYIADNFKQLFIDCQEKQLCIEGVKKGKACDKYDLTGFIIPNLSIAK